MKKGRGYNIFLITKVNVILKCKNSIKVMVKVKGVYYEEFK